MAERASLRDQVAEIDRMMREIGWHTQKQSAHMLARPEIDLTLPQMITLFAIHDSGTCRMSMLADVTQQSAGTLTGIVDRLIEDGLVARVRNATDRRVVEVTLTPEGERRLQQVSEARHEGMARILEHFGEADLEQLERLLRQFLAVVQRDDNGSQRMTREVEA